jgi:PAS domain S-box-containing protein
MEVTLSRKWAKSRTRGRKLHLVEAQTSQTEDELRAIIDNAPVFLWSDLPDGYCDFLNQPWLTYFNLSLQEAQGAGWATVLHPDDAAHHLESWQKSVATGTPLETEARFRRLDGEYRWFLNRAYPLRDKTGRIVKWYGTNIDIENLKRTESRLRQSEANLAEAQRLSHTGSWATSPATRKILYWSEECYRIWGFDPLQGPPYRAIVWKRIHPDDRDRMNDAVQEALRQKRDYAIEFRIVLPDGTVKYLETTGHHVFSARGELVQAIGTNVDVTERKRAEKVLRDSEAKIRRLVDANIIGIFIWDFDGRILEANEAFLHIVGYDHEDLVAGRIRWTDLTPPEWRDRDTRLIQEHKEAGILRPFEKEYFRKDGSRVPVLIGVATFEDGENQGVAFVLDLTERKRAEEALRDSAEALRRSEAYVAESQRLSHTGTAVYNDTTILHWSDETYRIFGFDPRDGLPSREAVLQAIHPDDRERVEEEARQGVRQKRDYKLEYRLVLAATTKYIEGIGHPKFSASGELVEVVCTLVDVTERKRAEEALRRSSAWLTQAQRLSRTGNWVYDATTNRYLYWSDESYRIWGFDPLQGLPSREDMWQRIHPDDRDRVLDEVQKSLRQKRDFAAEFRIVLPDGTIRYLEATTRHKFSPLGELGEAVSSHVDVTERKRAQEEHERLRQLESDLAHMNRLSMMGEMTASLAHEITQPIASARNNARAAVNFLDKQPPDLGEVREALDCVVGDADRAGDIVDRIRDQAKKAPARKHRFDLNEAINEVVELAHSAISENGISVQTRLSEALPPVEGDRVQLQQVVLNLILNAVEAMSSVEVGRRELLISTEQNQTGDVLAAVRDSGPGIDAERLEDVFEAFYTTKSGGVGLGLSICRSIIEGHGGRLWAEANEPRGAVFQFTFPSAESELMNSLQTAHPTREPCEGTVSDYSHQPAYEGNKQPHRSGRESDQRHWGMQ